MTFLGRLKEVEKEILYGQKEVGVMELDDLFAEMKETKCHRCEEEHGYRCCDPQCEWRCKHGEQKL